jgi:tetratricopeptide (TPR) repeat protein
MFNVKLFSLVFLLPLLIYSQKGDIINHIYEGNEEADQEKYSEAEIKYRKALSISPEETKALFNLGNTHFNDKDFDEASQRFFQTQKFSKDKNEKHMAFHNMGNVFMKKKDYAKAVESYKNALRNNPKDDETRYNYALAKELLEKEKQKDQNKDKNKDKENKEDKNKSDKKEGKNDKDDENKEDKSKNKNKDKKDKSKKNQNDRSKKENDQNQERKRKPGQLSAEQIKSILEAMSNQEKNVQKKINAKKVKGSPIKNVKDW